ncbi:MAG: helicase RepA family protein [Desulfobacterales bacterium]|nr:helicase RepA family protein [Desulfobacterales bacterium]
MESKNEFEEMYKASKANIKLVENHEPTFDLDEEEIKERRIQYDPFDVCTVILTDASNTANLIYLDKPGIFKNSNQALFVKIAHDFNDKYPGLPEKKIIIKEIRNHFKLEDNAHTLISEATHQLEKILSNPLTEGTTLYITDHIDEFIRDRSISEERREFDRLINVKTDEGEKITVDDYETHLSNMSTIMNLSSKDNMSNHILDKKKQDDMEDKEWIIKDFFHNDTLGMIYGMSGTLKSYLAGHMACSVCSGLPFLGKYKVNNSHIGSVFYIAAEGQHEIKERRQAWEKANKYVLANDDFIVYDRPENFVETPNLARMFVDALKKKHPKVTPKLVIIDTLHRCWGGISENDSAAMGIFVNVADELKRMWDGATVIIIHHTNNAGSGPRGSGALNADIHWTFETKGSPSKLNLKYIKTKSTPILPEIIIKTKSIELKNNKSNLILEYEGTVAGEKHKEKDEENSLQENALLKHIPILTASEVNRDTGVSKSDLQKLNIKYVTEYKNPKTCKPEKKIKNMTKTLMTNTLIRLKEKIKICQMNLSKNASIPDVYYRETLLEKKGR